jgi:hypothetical protein
MCVAKLRETYPNVCSKNFGIVGFIDNSFFFSMPVELAVTVVLVRLCPDGKTSPCQITSGSSDTF